MMNLRVFKNKVMLLMLLFAFSAQGVWADPDPSTDGTRTLAIEALNLGVTANADETYPGWNTFPIPGVRVYKMDGDKEVRESEKYTFTYFVNGKTTENIVTDELDRKVTIDDVTKTKVDNVYGNITVGSLPGTVTVKVVATPKEAYKTTEGLTELSKTYSFKILSITPTITTNPASMTLYVRHGETDKGNGTYDFENVSQKLLLPQAKATITVNSYTQDLTQIYDISYAVKDGFISGTEGPKYSDYLSIVENNTYLQAFVSSADASGSQVPQNEIKPNPYTKNIVCPLTITLTPKEGYAGTYSTLTKDVNVTISPLNNASKPQVQFTIAEEGQTIHWSRWNERGGKTAIHTLPKPTVIASNGAVLTDNPKIQVNYFAVMDTTYTDKCEWNELVYNETSRIRKSGLPTQCDLSNTSDWKYYYKRLSETPQLMTNYQGHIKVGMFLSIPNDDSAMDFKNWYQYWEEKTLQREGHDYLPETVNAKDKDGNNILDKDNNPVMVASNGVDINTDFIRLTDIKYFDLDIMPRTPILTFNPDPQNVVVSTADEITFNNRFELSGYIDDRNDGTAGKLEFGPNEYGSDHFSYSFEFAADAGIKVINWPHGDKVVALDVDGKPVEPLDYDWANGGMPIYVKYGKKTIHHDYGTWSWDEEVVDEGNEANIEKYPEGHAKAGQNMDVRSQIATYKYWSTKGYGTDHLWKIKFTKESVKDGDNYVPYEIKYTLYPYNHARWDIGETITKGYIVEEGKTPILNIDPKELVATKGQLGFVEPDVWVTDLSGAEISDHFTFTYSISSDPNATGTTVANSEGRTFKHEVTIGNKVGTVTVHVVAEGKKNSNNEYITPYKTQTLEGDYIIHILDDVALYEIISSHDDDAKDGNISNDADHQYEAADAKVMGKLHFIKEGNVYSGYTISGIPGLDVRFGKFDGSTTWEVKTDATNEVGSQDNNNDVSTDGAGVHNKFITESTPVVLDANGIATGGSYYEFYAQTNGYLTIDGRLEAGKTYVLIDFDNPEIKEVVTPETTIKGDYTFKMPLIEDHSYHLYGLTEGCHINMHGLSFEPAFINAVTDKYNGAADVYPGVQKGSAFMNNFMNVPELTYDVVKDVTYSSDNTEYATVDTKGTVTPVQLTIKKTPNPYVNIRAKITSNVTSPKGNPIYKWPTYKLYIADIPMYRLGDDKRKNHTFASDALKKDGFSEAGAIYAPVPGDTVSTYNILTPIRMTYGGWKNNYKIKSTDTESTHDYYEPKTANEIGGMTSNDFSFNKHIDNFTWSNVAKTDPIDEEGNKDYKNYITDPAKKDDEHFKNTFTLPTRGAYWRFEPRESGTIFVYLVQNGICSYTGNPSLLSQTNKNYNGLDWKPLYIVDEAGLPVETNASTADNVANNLLAGIGDNANSYTEGLVRCEDKDEDIRNYMNNLIAQGLIPDASDKINSGEFAFAWKYKKQNKSDGNVQGFDVDYLGANKDAFKNQIINAWNQKKSGDVQNIIKDEESNGYTLLSKSYVRYAIPVKAGKSYWVFQYYSKPNFCGFAFVPQNYLKEEGEAGYIATKEFKISDTKEDDDFRSGRVTYDADCNVTYQGRTFANKTWTSLCLPFAVSEYNFKKIFGENAKIVTYEKLTKNNTNIHFIQHNYHMMEAGRPYFIYPDYDETEAKTNGKSNIVFEGVTFEENKPAANDVTIPAQKVKIFESDGFQFVGTYEGEMMPVYSYFIQESLRRVGPKDPSTGEARDPEAGLFLAPYRAYLKNPTHNVNFARIGMSNFEEPFEDIPEDMEHTVTKIAGVTDGNIFQSTGGAASLKGIYNLDGKLISNSASDVDKLPAGIYIVNGQKVIK